jgi:UDP-N-acetylglucosamine diphosphorylase / glucose-1-phosphate thymidylyltransferase / UDP-N-acetylgalactosamine diphosphorylase / glucosamine-1-phosphate N-acetyltransferase / galactosamine-1-phosphate N-acetyltransferase
MNILIFEDNFYGNIFPLSMLRPVYDVVTGVYTNRERLEKINPSKYKISLHCGNILLPLMESENHGRKINIIEKEDYLFINGNIVFDEEFIVYAAKKMKWDTALMHEGKVVCAKISKGKLTYIKHKIENRNIDNTLGLKDFDNFALINDPELIEKYNIKIIHYAWDVIRHFEYVIIKDLENICAGRKKVSPHTGVSVVNLKGVKIAKSANVYPNVVLDADSGSICIDENAVIEPFSYIKGPAYIGKNVTVKSGAKIYGPCSIGAGSKVTGEISGSVFQANVNKQHPFVNFGADTVTSNLKNNYSKVRVKFGGGQINTEMQFLGTLAGDHTKFGINTMLNTGTIAGIYANIAGGGFPDKKIDSFSWNILGSEPVKYKLEEALATAKTVMGRRHIDMSAEYEELIREIYKSI